jgi:heat shock protein HslJ
MIPAVRNKGRQLDDKVDRFPNADPWLLVPRGSAAAAMAASAFRGCLVSSPQIRRGVTRDVGESPGFTPRIRGLALCRRLHLRCPRERVFMQAGVLGMIRPSRIGGVSQALDLGIVCIVGHGTGGAADRERAVAPVRHDMDPAARHAGSQARRRSPRIGERSDDGCGRVARVARRPARCELEIAMRHANGSSTVGSFLNRVIGLVVILASTQQAYADARCCPSASEVYDLRRDDVRRLAATRAPVISQTGDRANSGSDRTDLFGRRWTLTEIEGRRFSADEPNIAFDRDQRRTSGSSGCNRFTGAFQIDGTALKFSPLAGTRRACLDAELQRVEASFLKLLAITTRFEVRGNTLRLFANETLTLVFAVQ